MIITYKGIKKNNAHIIIKQYKPILPTVRCFGRGPLGIVDISYLRICFLDKIHKAQGARIHTTEINIIIEAAKLVLNLLY